jgi:hypothetical protein
MKKVFIVLGIIALLLIIFAVASFDYESFNGRHLDTTSKAYVDTNLPVIFSTWSRDELLKLASSELRQTINDDQANLLLSKMEPLGKFQKYEGSKGESKILFNYRNWKIVKTASYIGSASFQNGTAQIEVKLIWRDGKWQIGDFTITSPIFLK